MTDLPSKPLAGFPILAVVIGGLAAGAIDIGAASLITGHDPVFILHTIAGGLLAKAAFAGGWRTAALGLALQEAMGVVIAIIYGLIARLAPDLARAWIVGGLVYGAVIFFVMNDVVVPLSAWKVTPHFTVMTFAENMLAMLVFGLIVAFASRRGSK
jgi:uncharacterized membrane protein YagU involved in acid resistance